MAIKVGYHDNYEAFQNFYKNKIFLFYKAQQIYSASSS